MEVLLESMFIKRFCIPSNVDIDTYAKENSKNIKNCLCGHYNHVSCIFRNGNGKNMKKINILGFGINKYADVEGLNPGVHAEKDVLMKLPYNKCKKRPITINLLVIRLSKTNKIQNSKPCTICIREMSEIPKKRGYKIQNVLYSDSEGNIVKTCLRNLEEEEQHLSRFYRKRTNL